MLPLSEHKRPNSNVDPSPAVKRPKIEVLADYVTTIQRLEHICIGLSHGLKGYDNFEPQDASREYADARKSIYIALNNHDDAVRVTLEDNSTLTIREVGLNLEVEMSGEKILLLDKSFRDIRGTLGQELFQESETGSNWDVFIRNTFKYGDFYRIYSKSIVGRDFDKTRGYLSVRDGQKIVELNGEVPRTDSDKNYLCRHFIAQIIEDSITGSTGNGKLHASPFKNPQSIQTTMSSFVEHSFSSLICKAKICEIFHNDEFGLKIATGFEDMQHNGEKIKKLMIVTTTHAMALELRIKNSNGKPVYAVKFYDPNFSNATMKLRANAPAEFEGQTLKQYIVGWATKNGIGQYAHYFNGNVSPVSVAFECDVDSLNDNLTVPRKLRTLGLDQLTPTHLLYLLVYKFYDDFAALLGDLKKIGEQSSDKLVDLLSGRNNNGKTLLYFALTVKEEKFLTLFLPMLRELKQFIPQDKLAKLIAALGPDGVPAMYSVLKNGGAKIARLYGDYIALIDDENVRAELILARNSDSEPGIVAAYLSGHYEAAQEGARWINNLIKNPTIRESFKHVKK